MGKKFGRVHRVHLETNTTAEAVRYLCSQFPASKAYLMQAKDKGIGFAVWRGKENITEEQLREPVGNDDIRIAPIIMGSKSGGVFNIILGAVLMVAGAYVGMVLGNPALGKAIADVGFAMIVGGVVQFLTPVPKGTKNKSVSNEPSYAFNGAVNT